MNKNTGKVTILYERLSRDDENSDISGSIQNQRDFLENYATQNGLLPFKHLQDDGYSGTQWARPGWQELIGEVEAGRVSAVVVKNLDRVGRDYLRVGLFMEQMRDAGVRLICVSDGIDTANGVEDDFTPFRAILAEWYAKDCSKKIRTIFNSRMAQGYHCTGSIPYGYIHNPDNRQEWLLDEGAAAVVRRIFQLVIDGKGIYQIAQILEADKVLIPSAHLDSIGIKPRHDYTDPCAWRGGVVGSILERREYTGVKILKKTFTESYKQKKRQATPVSEQFIFEGAIPQIIDLETWELAQKLRRTVRRPARDGRSPSPLTGLLICADCGKKLTHAGNFEYRRNRQRDEYVCGNYRQGTKKCTIHYIRTSVINELIISAIRGAAACVRQDETAFIEKVRAASNLRAEAEVKESKKRLNKSVRRCDELDTLVKKLYETYALGKLSENHFDRMIAEYDAEQSELRQTIAELQTEVDNFAADSVRADRFIEIVRRYTAFDALTTPMMNEFIEAVIVHEADRSSGKRKQEVEVVFNFIGKFDAPPIPTPLPEVDAAEEQAKQEAKRARNRERLRLWRAKKKAERAAAKLAETQTETA